MPWFRLEDTFHSNPKVIAAGNAAVGLWIRSATWSAQYLTDGVIPADVVRSLNATRPQIDALTNTRLWVPIDDTYVLRDWSEYQPSSLEVRQRRRQETERKREQRKRGQHNTDRDELGRFVPHDNGTEP